MGSSLDASVIVVGGGHAGAEAALAAARMGLPTACVVMQADAIGRMSCNPAIGGLAKGQLVREIDALGGEMGRATDAAGIQFRMLNTKKGPAVRSPRAQCDRAAYNRYMVDQVTGQADLAVIEAEATGILAEAGRVTGVRLADGRELRAQAVVLTTGTFLAGRLFAGEWEESGGRLGERGASQMSESLLGHGLRLGRHKTGTPPRLAADSIDFSALVVQPGDPEPRPFSFRTKRLDVEQVDCHITHTNPQTHQVIAAHAHLSPMYQGRIVGLGPRYCPSVEDKVMRFRDQAQHQIFLEPEGLDSDEIYPNGISTSLPVEVQESFLRTIRGLESVVIRKPGYAVEYDYLCTDQIRADLQVGGVAGLFAAGQINGTSGYEEAAAQGLMAGINAARFARQQSPVILDRATAYIGVMIDDLCRVNPVEPYRMFTSRAEFRLLLRSDNADRRLSPLGHKLGLLDAAAAATVATKEREIGLARELLETSYRRDSKSLATYLRRPAVSLAGMLDTEPALAELRCSPDLLAEIEAEVKYEGYIKRQAREVEKMQRMHGKPIPRDFDFHNLTALSAEARERLSARQPLTLGEASRMPGVRVADLNLLLAVLSR
ncbi:MAG: tRNA uridine-5-carboxymethylaminomethyl(34) synthesis enzyme MnmG [Planctomycetota bacterium]|nr:tRNA uridine-5-carboxymethylaminomethyl(34) synthesis enzyme MnmG [Planctomycetota bacterium]